jgi:hypothetical protein
MNSAAPRILYTNDTVQAVQMRAPEAWSPFEIWRTRIREGGRSDAAASRSPGKLPDIEAGGES